MLPHILFAKAPEQCSTITLLGASESPTNLTDTEALNWVTAQLNKEGWCAVNRYSRWQYFIQEPTNKHEAYKNLEKTRQYASAIYQHANKQKVEQLKLETSISDLSALEAFMEGFMLSGYNFSKYKKEKKEPASLYLPAKLEQGIKSILSTIEATAIARTLVNEPVVFLTATELSNQIKSLGEEAGFSVEVLEEAKIQSLKMGGLLAVNAGSVEPPTFSILHYKPTQANNKQPIILVGKGVVYDTGGLSIKPTAGSMDIMKSDMGGAAAVVGTLYAVAKAKLPVEVIGLIPATDNRPGGNAIAPGDVITQYDGTTVEILNTDAEGRLILADALAYAKKYNPELVIDLATLTGAAARAIGPEGVVYMGTADAKIKVELEEAGRQTYERLVEFPLWEEYEEQLKSTIADMTNLGGANAGAITAGKFLQHFTDYPWLHLDIAGPAYVAKQHHYRTAGGTGVGVRLLFQFLKHKFGK